MNRTEKSYIRPLLLGTAIFAVIVLHLSVSQFIAFENDKSSPVTELIDKQPAEIMPEFKVEKEEIKAVPEKAVLSDDEPKPAPKRAVMKQTVIKKKEAPRESRAERLRRAEKILTGV